MDEKFYTIVKEIQAEKRANEIAYKNTLEYRTSKLVTYYYLFCRCSGVQCYRNVYGNFLEFLKSDIYAFISEDCNFNIAPEKITKDNFIKTQFVSRVTLDFENLQKARRQRVINKQTIYERDLQQLAILKNDTVSQPIIKTLCHKENFARKVLKMFNILMRSFNKKILLKKI